MLSRRQFLLATAGALSPGLILPTFYERAFSFLENHDEPLLVPPKKTEHTLYVMTEHDCALWLDSTVEEPPRLTWREFIERYYGSVKGYLDFQAYSVDAEEFGSNLDAEADYWQVVDRWVRSDSPNAEAYHLLHKLDLGMNGSNPDSVGELIFYDCPMPGSDYLGVHVEDLLSVSILQQELNRLGKDVRVEMA